MPVDFSNPPKPPPVKKTSGPKPSARATQAKTDERAEGILGLFQLASAGCLMFRQYADAATCAKHGPGIAQETAKLAETNENVGRVLDFLTQVGPFAGLLAVTLPFAMQIAVNHNRLPAAPLAQFGVVHPDALAAQAQLDAVRMQREAMQAEEQARREMADLAAHMNGAGDDT